MKLLLYLFFQIVDCQLQLSSYPPTNGSYCPGNITFTCSGSDIATGLDDAYPVVIFSNQSLSIRIINASVASRVSHDVHSQMIGTWDFLWNKTVQCQVYSESSPLFLVKIRDFPPSPIASYCSMCTNTEVALQWSTPINSSEDVIFSVVDLSTNNTNTKDVYLNYDQNYTLHRLEENQQYYFNVSSLNCISQRTGPFLFKLETLRSLSSIFTTTSYAWSHNQIFIEIHWNYQELRRSNLITKFAEVTEFEEAHSINLQVCIKDESGRVHVNFSFSQVSYQFCETDEVCIIKQHLYTTEVSHSYFLLSITALDDNGCDGLLNSYIERLEAVPSRLVGFSAISKNDAVIARCWPLVDNTTCFLQYRVLSLHNDTNSSWNFTDVEVNKALIQLQQNNSYFFKITLLISPTYKIEVLYIYNFYKEVHEIYLRSSPSPTFLTTQLSSTRIKSSYGTVVFVMSAILMVILVTSTIWISALFYKLHKQRRRHEESRGCGSKLHDRDMETAKVSEAIYDQICDRASVNSEVVKNEQYIHYQYHK